MANRRAGSAVEAATDSRRVARALWRLADGLGVNRGQGGGGHLALIALTTLLVLTGLNASLELAGCLARRQAKATSGSPAQIVVDFRDDLGAGRIAALGRHFGLQFRANSPMSTRDKLMVADVSRLSPAQCGTVLAALQADSREVEAADHNYVRHVHAQRLGAKPGDEPRGRMTPNDPRYPEQWGLALIGMPAAWETTQGEGAVVAVIDTGCAFEEGYGFPAASDLQGTKWVRGYDFVRHTDRAYDDMGHGTHVAGTIAQTTNNGYGVAGIAFRATIMPIKVVTADDNATDADTADGIIFAADHGANVINMSLGGYNPSRVLGRAICYAHEHGVTIVCSAGNGARRKVEYPAAFPECVAVSACGPEGDPSFYTSYGPQVALIAPGGDYRNKQDSAKRGVLQNTVAGKVDGFEFWQGTSMASPHVAGVAALLVSQGVKDPEAVRARLKATATPKPGGDPDKYGAGLLNAAAAVGAASQR